MHKELTTRIIFIFLFLIPSLAQAYTESFYVCDGGNGTAPEAANCATAYDEADFNSSGNWSSSDANDGKIGPNDIVYLMDDGGTFNTALTFQAGGTPGKPITMTVANGDDVVITPSSNTNTITIEDDYITIDGDLGHGNDLDRSHLTINATTGDASYIFNIEISNSGSSCNTDNGEYFVLDHVTLVGAGSGGSDGRDCIRTCADEFTITNNEMSLCGMGFNYEIFDLTGAPSTTKNGDISYNIIHDTNGPPAGNGDCVRLRGERTSEARSDFSGITVHHNQCYNFYDDGFDTFESKGVVIEYNEIGPSYTANAGDCTGIKGSGNNGSANDWIGHETIRYNYIHDINMTGCSANANFGISTSGSSGQTIYGNFIENVTGRGINIDAAQVSSGFCQPCVNSRTLAPSRMRSHCGLRVAFMINVLWP